jgi:hypothetical protein
LEAAHGGLGLARAHVDPSEAEVATGCQQAHSVSLGMRHALPVGRLGPLGVKPIRMGRDVAAHLMNGPGEVEATRRGFDRAVDKAPSLVEPRSAVTHARGG